MVALGLAGFLRCKMKRIIKLLVICCFFGLTGCYGHVSSRPVPSDVSAIDTTTIQETELNKINAIQAQGNFSLRIIAGARKNHIRIKGLTSGVSAIGQKLHKNTLILTANEDKKP